MPVRYKYQIHHKNKAFKMKKFLFVAILAAGSLVACNDTSNTVNGVDTTSPAYKDSMAKVNGGGSMMTTPDTSNSMMTKPDTSSSMMSKDTGSTMMNGSDTSHK